MYRSSTDYDYMAKLAIEVRVDYGITGCFIDEKELCRKMGIELFTYSDFYSILDLSSLSDEAFYIPSVIDKSTGKINPPKIIYNEKIASEGRIRFSILHEVKHFLCNDNSEESFNEDMANYFARYMLCPIPILIYKNITNIDQIITECNVSREVASNVLKNLSNRRKYHGDKIFEYEKPLIELLKGDCSA